jgi:hypothetical protein
LGERPHFAVSARKFEQLVAYVATIDKADRTGPGITAKLRGMLAEIRVGVHTVEARWSVTIPQMYSLVQHAVLAHDLHQLSTVRKAEDFASYYTRVRWRTGRWWQSMIQYRLDLIMFRAGGETDPLAMSNLRWFFATNKFDHKHVYNPYQRAGTYRIVNLDVRASDRLNPLVEEALKPRSWGKHAKTLGSYVALSAKATKDYVSQWEVKTPTWNVKNWSFKRHKPPEPPPETPRPFIGVPPQTVPLPESPTPSPTPTRPSTPLQTPQAPAPEPPPPAKKKEKLPLTGVYINSRGINFLADETDSEPEEAGNEPELEPTPPAAPPPAAAVAPPPSDNSDSESSASSAGPAIEPVTPFDDRQLLSEEDKFDAWLHDAAKNGQLHCIPSYRSSPTSNRTLNWSAPLQPVSLQHDADHRFAMILGNRKRFVWPKAPMVVPCPSNGACHIIDAAVHDIDSDYTQTLLPKPTASVYNLNARKIVDMFKIGNEEDLAPELLGKFEKFAELSMRINSTYLVKILMIEGPPMSAKSSLVRTYITSNGEPCLVYVPSTELKRAWDSHPDFKQFAEVMTRQSRPKTLRAKIGIIDEVFNFGPIELYLHLRVLRSRGCETIILLGDRSQREETGIVFEHEYLERRIEMHTSLGMPRDAHALYVHRNRLAGMGYDTTGTKETSIFFTQKPLDYEPDLEFRMHKHAGTPNAPKTVGQVQGSRARNACFHVDTTFKQASWLTSFNNRWTVAFTRHTNSLVVMTHANIADSWVPGLVYYTVVGKRDDLEKPLHPRVMDDLVLPLKGSKINSLITPLRAALIEPLVLEGHYVVIPKAEEQTSVAAKSFMDDRELRSFSLENANFALPSPDEIDLVTDQPRRTVTFRAPGPPVQRTDVRNDLPESHLLAAIHSNQSAFDSLKNLIDRQVATTKTSAYGTTDMKEGYKIYRRFRDCYYRPEATILDVEKQAFWLQSAEVNALNMIVNSDPLGETASTLTVDAEFKTQSKAKAVPGFAATLPYGQSILANSKQFNAYFAQHQPRLYLNLPKLLRDNVILDYGMSDNELSSRLASIGVAADLNGPRNVQADVSKQDSSHTAAFLYAFVMIARDCGVDDQALEFYLAYSRRYLFRSRGEDGTTATVSFNLGSGDPFTLIRNDVMELCVIACRYAHAKTMTIVEKGDDVHGVIVNLAPCPLEMLPSIKSVKLKIDYGTVGYHAGRFHNGKRYLVDPVRAFLKHFTRLQDENVTNSVLYSSYISRATDYDDEEVEFLLNACQVFYPHYSSSHIYMMINTMIAIRDRDVFERYSIVRLRKHAVAIDTRSGCAENCVRALRPGRHKTYYAQFRGLRLDLLVARLNEHGIPYIITDLAKEIPRNTIALNERHAKLWYDVTEPHGTFKIQTAPTNLINNVTVDSSDEWTPPASPVPPHRLELYRARFQNKSRLTVGARASRSELTPLLSATSSNTPKSNLPESASPANSALPTPPKIQSDQPSVTESRPASKSRPITVGAPLSDISPTSKKPSSATTNQTQFTSGDAAVHLSPQDSNSTCLPLKSVASTLKSFLGITRPSSTQKPRMNQPDQSSWCSSTLTSIAAELTSVPHIKLTPHDAQLTAIIGDLAHKTAVYKHFASFGPTVDRFFSNAAQARYLLLNYPELVPTGPDPPSDHRIASVFEVNFVSSLTFELDYMQKLRDNPSECLPINTDQASSHTLDNPSAKPIAQASISAPPVTLRMKTKSGAIAKVVIDQTIPFGMAVAEFCKSNGFSTSGAKAEGQEIPWTISWYNNKFNKKQLITFTKL